MKSSISIVPSVFILLLVTAQGIRLDHGFSSPIYVEIHEERSSIEGNAVGQEVICTSYGHCSGRSRKLKTVARSTPESPNNKGVEVEAAAKHTQRQGKSSHEHLNVKPTMVAKDYPDDIDVAEMDYSPAKRKPPIHN